LWGLQLEGIQPMVTVDDCLDAEDICKADAKFRKVIEERYGIVDLDLVACDPWYYGDRYVYGESLGLPRRMTYLPILQTSRERRNNSA
jgi:Cu2+-containing amine oxidase